MAKGWGIFKPAGEDDPGPIKDEADLADKVNKVSKLGSIKNSEQRKNEALGLLGDINKIVERGKARQAKNEERRKGK